MNELQIFNSPEFGHVRVIEINGEPWLVGKDVATALGYINPRDAMNKHVDDEDKGVAKCDTLGGTQEMTVINESGLFSLVLGSKLPHAKNFKRWVTKEVLPSIRKHGMYATNELLDNPDLLIQVATALKEERERNKFLVTQVDEQQKVIEQQQPKVTYYDLVLQCTELLTTTEIAKDYGLTAQWLNKFLKNKKIQFLQGSKKHTRWFLYAKYAQMGYAQSKTHPYIDKDGIPQSRTHLYWTQKGRYFIYETLKNDGIVPIIESED